MITKRTAALLNSLAFILATMAATALLVAAGLSEEPETIADASSKLTIVVVEARAAKHGD
ncbi:hypothetical protein C7T35_07760 [Variovorax sp. WS11]|uniref:hypothetical protein n=1 Tax=Variovorax sp. WS11 TaxID=1105204 RepID=UPI000D0D7C2D|nr:hypothetical protein [Variovorax sp. WS11]NDZ18459.1 hypothetical protein [Variovorax sp. WS11]PSL85105.1 hypothetical protein C7T35_07760 [Variovorax sp. WS11]